MKSAPQSSNWFAALIVLLNTTAFAQESKLTEQDKRLIYSRAYEAILWASPALAIIAMDERVGEIHSICRNLDRQCFKKGQLLTNEVASDQRAGLKPVFLTGTYELED